MNNSNSAPIEPTGMMTDAELNECIADLLVPLETEPITTDASVSDAAGDDDSIYEIEADIGGGLSVGVYRAGVGVEVEWISMEVDDGSTREVWVARDPNDSKRGAVLVLDHEFRKTPVASRGALARQFDADEFPKHLREGDAIALAVEAVRRVGEEVAE